MCASFLSAIPDNHACRKTKVKLLSARETLIVRTLKLNAGIDHACSLSLYRLYLVDFHSILIHAAAVSMSRTRTRLNCMIDDRYMHARNSLTRANVKSFDVYTHSLYIYIYIYRYSIKVII